MPNIKTFDQPGLGLQPSEIGVESRAAVGRRGGAFFNQAGQSLDTTGRRVGQSLREAGDVAVDYMDHQQINAGAEHGANLFAGLTDSWNQVAANADPHDPSVAKKWREEQLEPALQQFQQGFSTEKSQQWAEHFVDQTRTHMFAKTEADMSSMAAAAVTSSVTTLANKFSNTAITDPSSVPGMLDVVDHSIDGIIGANPNLKGAAAARVREEVGEKIREQIVKAGAIGAMQKGGDPDAIAAKWTKDYPQYINGAEAVQLAKSAIYYNRLNTSEARADRVQRDYENRQDFNSKIDALEAATMPRNVGDRPQLPKDYWDQMRKLSTHPGAALEPGRLKTMVDSGNAITARLARPEQPVTDPEVYSTLSAKLLTPGGLKDSEIVANEGSLNDHDFKRLRESAKMVKEEMFKDPAFLRATDAAKQLLEAKGLKLPAFMTAGAYANFLDQFMPEYRKQYLAGTLQPNALNVNDPKSLISQFVETNKTPLGKTIGANGGVGSPATPTPPVSAPKVPALPPKDKLVVGQTYPTSGGPGVWTGTVFKVAPRSGQLAPNQMTIGPMVQQLIPAIESVWEKLPDVTKAQMQDTWDTLKRMVGAGPANYQGFRHVREYVTKQNEK